MREVWREDLGRKFTAEADEAWSHVFAFIMENLQLGFRKALQQQQQQQQQQPQEEKEQQQQQQQEQHQQLLQKQQQQQQREGRMMTGPSA